MIGSRWSLSSKRLFQRLLSSHQRTHHNNSVPNLWASSARSVSDPPIHVKLLDKSPSMEPTVSECSQAVPIGSMAEVHIGDGIIKPTSDDSAMDSSSSDDALLGHSVDRGCTTLAPGHGTNWWSCIDRRPGGSDINGVS